MPADPKTVESRVLEAVLAFAQPLAPPAAIAEGSVAASEWISRRKVSDLLRRLPRAYELEASIAPAARSGLTAASGTARRANANKAVTYALEALRQLGFVIRESGSRWDAGTADANKNGLTAPATDKPDLTCPVQPSVRRRLVVERWGESTDCEGIWFSIVRILTHGGASTAFVEEIKRYARTSFSISVGADAMFEREYAKAMAEGVEGSAAQGVGKSNNAAAGRVARLLEDESLAQFAIGPTQKALGGGRRVLTPILLNTNLERLSIAGADPADLPRPASLIMR